MNERYQAERFSHPNVLLDAGANIVPCARANETIPVVLAVFPDHGTPAFVGSTIQSRRQMIEAAKELSEAESKRIDYAWEKLCWRSCTRPPRAFSRRYRG